MISNPWRASGGPSAAAHAAASMIVPDPTDLAPILELIRSRHGTPGMIASVLEGRSITAIGAVGIRRHGHLQPMTVHDRVHLGSCTKAMTCTLIGKLVDEGKLTWYMPMSEALPSLAGSMEATAAHITIRQLMDHTAGLAANVDWWGYHHTGKPLPEQRQQIARDVLAQPPASVPGETYTYSNVGYMMLGAIIEDHRGRPWEEVIQEELFDPLGMSSAGFGYPGSIDQTDEPWGHTGSGNALTPVQFDNAPCLGPAGTAHCTMNDWAKFVLLHMDAEKGDARLISQDAFTSLHTPEPGKHYMGGWNILQHDWGGRVFKHTGSNTMWYCMVWAAPFRDFAVMVATNLGMELGLKAIDEASTTLIQHYMQIVPDKTEG